MFMSIPQKIDRIIEMRKGRSVQVEQEIERLRNVRQSAADFLTLRGELSKSGNEEISSKLNAIVVDRFIQDCDTALDELEQLKKRFSRNYIHMSFVGKARQGKSLVMQQISGLKSNIIPSSDGDHCTGAKSIITNSDEPELTADITFYPKDKIIEIVNDYLDEIFGKDEPKIHSISEISSLANRDLEARLDPGRPHANSRWRHLKKYIDHIAEIEDDLGKKEERVVTIKAEEIESYVAQYKSDDPDTRYYKYLGVKEANIKCRFPSHDTCGKLVLVDTVGLGDTAIGVEEEMIRAIKEDSDAIIYMLCPDLKGPIIDADHYKIIEDIAQKVSVDYAKEMLFWVINRNMGGGEYKGKIISRLAEDLERERLRNAVPICRALDVNCKDQSEVEGNLLRPVLEQMSSRLDEIDDLLVTRVQARLGDLYAFYQNLNVQIQGAYAKTVSQDVRRQFGVAIKDTLEKWQGDLKNLCDDRKKKRDNENTKFSNAFQEMLKRVLTRVPSKEVIENYRRRKKGQQEREITYIYITRHIRNRIIDDFLSLDAVLAELVRELKREIVHILADDDKGKLGYVVPFSDDIEPDEWLDGILQIIEGNGYDEICQALSALRKFSMSVKGFFIYPVRSGLDSLDIDITDRVQVPVIEGDDLNPEVLAESMHTILKRCIFDVQKKIREDCKYYLSFPNSALYAAARDFQDRAVLTITSLDAPSMEIGDKWRYFYEDHLMDIWPEDCAKYTNAYRMNEDLDKLVKSIKNLCRKNNFQI